MKLLTFIGLLIGFVSVNSLADTVNSDIDCSKCNTKKRKENTYLAKTKPSNSYTRKTPPRYDYVYRPQSKNKAPTTTTTTTKTETVEKIIYLKGKGVNKKNRLQVLVGLPLDEPLVFKKNILDMEYPIVGLMYTRSINDSWNGAVGFALGNFGFAGLGYDW